MEDTKSERNYFAKTMRIATCPVCGKTFIPAAKHAYKILNNKTKSYNLVCSWGCVRKHEKAKQKQKERKSR